MLSFILLYYSLSQRYCWGLQVFWDVTLLSKFRKNIGPSSCKGQALQDELGCLDRVLIDNTFVRNVETFSRWQCLIQQDRNPSFSYFFSNSIHFFVLPSVHFLSLLSLLCRLFFLFFFLFVFYSNLSVLFYSFYVISSFFSSVPFYRIIFSYDLDVVLSKFGAARCLHICTMSPAICSVLSSYKALLK
jgi:hypothetical protein